MKPLLLITLILSACAIDSSTPIPITTGTGAQSSGFYDYCLDNEELFQCQYTYPELSSYAYTPYFAGLELTPELFKTLHDVNSDINFYTKYTTDPFNVWKDARISNQGDCEDHAIAKMLELIGKGVPQQAMGLVLTNVNSNPKSNHVVLVVSTNQGAYVLDNRSDWVKPHFMMQGSFIHVPNYLKRAI